MKHDIKFIFLTFVLVALALNGCKKKEVEAVDNESQSVVDNAIAEQEFLTVPPTTQQLAINTKGTGAQGKGLAAPCDTLTRISGDTLFGQPNHVDPTYTLNLSNTACSQVMPDGRPRTGYLTIRFTNKLRLAGAKMIIKFHNYKATNITYSCDSMIVTTVGSNSLSSTFNVKLINGVCTTSNWLVKYSLDRTITTYPKGNPLGSQPYTSIYGTSNGVNRQGKAFTVTVNQNTPLIKYRNCEFISSGVLELLPEGFKARSVDYGNGACDDDATFTVNGNTIGFKLK